MAVAILAGPFAPANLTLTLVSTLCGSSKVHLGIWGNWNLWHKLLKLLDEVIFGHNYFNPRWFVQLTTRKESPSCPNFLLQPFQAVRII